MNISENITREEYSYRGGGCELDLTEYGYEDEFLSAYQNYLGGGLLLALFGWQSIFLCLTLFSALCGLALALWLSAPRRCPAQAPAWRAHRGERPWREIFRLERQGLRWLRRQRHQARDTILCRRMRAQPGRFGIPPAGQQPGSPRAAHPLDLRQRRGEPVRISRQLYCHPVGIELSHT